jgi:type IV pilus assembly protein PilB
MINEEIENDFIGELRDSDTSSIIVLVNKIIAQAITEKVSHIHIEPQANNLIIRFRKDGILQQAIDPLPRNCIPTIASRFKIIANLDVSERRLPQQGKIRRVFQGRKRELLISTLPCQFGERMVIKIQDDNVPTLNLENLIRDSKTHSLLKELLNQPRGLILVTSPSNAGKTTTLYTLLAQCNKPSVNICTLEDPIELEFPGITQVQIIRDKDRDYASSLNTLLTQDADVILLGDIPDRETAIATLVAARKSLVLAGLYAKSTENAIHDLQLTGIENWRIARSLLGVINQRLLRRVCQDCRLVHHPTREELGQFGELTFSISNSVIYKAKELTPAKRVFQVNQELIQNNICRKCGGVGYEGLLAVCEVLIMTEEMQNLIVQGSSMDIIRKAAISAGMRTILENSLDLLTQGETTLEELENYLTS